MQVAEAIVIFSLSEKLAEIVTESTKTKKLTIEEREPEILEDEADIEHDDQPFARNHGQYLAVQDSSNCKSLNFYPAALMGAHTRQDEKQRLNMIVAPLTQLSQPIVHARDRVKIFEHLLDKPKCLLASALFNNFRVVEDQNLELRALHMHPQPPFLNCTNEAVEALNRYLAANSFIFELFSSIPMQLNSPPHPHSIQSTK